MNFVAEGKLHTALLRWNEACRHSTEAKMQPSIGQQQSIIEPARRAAKRRSQLGILLVEDEEVVREAAGEILESFGYSVLKACTSSGALDVFREHRSEVGLLVTDVVLPGQNGRDLASTLRELSPDLKTIFISGYPENAVTQFGTNSGNEYYVAKPFSLNSLVCAIRQVLGEDTSLEKKSKRASCTG
jgi:CheY-like chemotaxis protein